MNVSVNKTSAGRYICAMALILSCLPVRAARLALVMGNDSYPGSELKNARNDARGIFNALRELGYSSRLVLDSNRTEMIKAVSTFASGIQPNDVVLIYYAGHGLQLDGENYLIPTDFRVSSPSQVPDEAYSLSHLLEEVSRHGASTQVVILDACRNNPFIRSSRSVSANGWAGAVTSAGSLFAFGTSPGSTAADEPEGDHGLFTKMLLRRIGTPSIDIEGMFQKVREDVIRESGGSQVPWTASSLIGTLHIDPRYDSNEEVLAPSLLTRRQTDQDGPNRSVEQLTDGSIAHPSLVTDEERAKVSEALADARGFKFDLAIGVLQNLVSLTPAPVPLRLLGLLLDIVGRHAEAKAALDRAIAIDPFDADAAGYRCLAELQMSQAPSPDDCMSTLVINPSSTTGHLVLSIVLARQNQLVRAEAEVRRALELTPGDPVSLSMHTQLTGEELVP